MTNHEDYTTQGSRQAGEGGVHGYDAFLATHTGDGAGPNSPLFEFDAQDNLAGPTSASEGGTATQPTIGGAYLDGFPPVKGENPFHKQKKARSTAPGTSNSKTPVQSVTESTGAGSLLPHDYERPATRSQSAQTRFTEARGEGGSKNERPSGAGADSRR